MDAAWTSNGRKKRKRTRIWMVDGREAEDFPVNSAEFHWPQKNKNNDVTITKAFHVIDLTFLIVTFWIRLTEKFPFQIFFFFYGWIGLETDSPWQVWIRMGPDGGPWCIIMWAVKDTVAACFAGHGPRIANILLLFIYIFFGWLPQVAYCLQVCNAVLGVRLNRNDASRIRSESAIGENPTLAKAELLSRMRNWRGMWD